MAIPIAGQATIPLSVLTVYAVTQHAHQRYLDALSYWYQIGAIYGIAGDNAAIQAAKETAWGNYGSVVPASYHNWCGLKTTAGGSNTDPNAHAQFPDDATGITAQFQHLAAYAGISLPAGSAIVDPRYALIPQGSATTYAALGGHWAPAANYGTQIEAMIQDARTYMKNEIGGAPVTRPGSIDGIPVVWMPAAQGNYDTDRQGTDLIIIHDIEGSASSAVSRFQTPGQQASVQWVTDPVNKRIIQCLDSGTTVGYGCGNYAYNQCSEQIENPGHAGQPFDPSVVDYAAHLTAWLVKEDNVPIVKLSLADVNAGKRGICGHQDIPDPKDPSVGGGQDHHGDPGSTWPWTKFLGLVAKYAGQEAPTVTNEPNSSTDPVTGYRIIGGMLARYRQIDQALKTINDNAATVIGRPVENEHEVEPGVIEQRFEKQTWQWRKGQSPDRFDILAVNINPYVKAP